MEQSKIIDTTDTYQNTYATLLHHPFLFKGKPTHAQEVASTGLLHLTRSSIGFSRVPHNLSTQ